MLKMCIFMALAAMAMAFTAALTVFVGRYAKNKSLVDIPNGRSSHDAPTPRGGGIAIVIVFYGMSAVYGVLANVSAGAMLAVLGGGAAVAGIGFLDDHGHVAARWRLVVHFAAGFFASALLGGLPGLPLGPWMLDFGWFGYLAAAVVVVWALNLYNFMDGIDGIACVELITVALGAGILLALHQMPAAAGWLVLLAACGAGFLVWNWPPATIFMGDAGSGFIGFALAVFALWTGHGAGMGLWPWLILAGIFLVDATWTLVRRIAHGQWFHQPHRVHAYQYAARWFGAHRPVTIGAGLVNLCWLFPLAALAAWYPQWGVLFAAVAWTPLMWICWWFGAGLPEKH